MGCWDGDDHKFKMASTKSQSPKCKIRANFDVKKISRFYKSKDSLFFYTVITFLTVIALYFLTKDLKGITSPEEVDLGSVRISRHHRQRHNRTRRCEDYY
ncbi:unnamed protein product [Leptosia nina]|uniref:Uncharacterized protein n=1 Tax=Leptosia nina TaxID=320188 RepID=A0AAV1JIY2_9NEOP